jgi:long-chain acyl-CoA synthetase
LFREGRSQPGRPFIFLVKRLDDSDFFPLIAVMGLIKPEELKTFGTIYDTILNTCQRVPDKDAFIGRDGTRLSYREIENQIIRISGGLKSLGLQNKDRVGILSENCPEWGIAYLAVLAAGGIVVPFDGAWKETELEFAIKISGVKYLICSSKYRSALFEIIRKSNSALKLIGLESDFSPNLKELARSDPFISKDISPEATAALIYTSGTTGDPKGVILTHANFLANLEGVVKALELYSDDIFLSVLPLHHTLEATCGFLLPLLAGSTIVYSRSLKSRDILDDIKNNSVTCLVAVPLLFEKMYKTIEKRLEELPLPKRIYLKICYQISRLGWHLNLNVGKFLFRGLHRKSGLGTIRMMVSGGAPLPKEIAEWFNLVGFTFLEGYGLTECAPVVAVNCPKSIRFGSVGPPLPNVEIDIDNPSPDGVGEIKVRGASTTPGYIDNPTATAALLIEGWLYTGDFGKMSRGHLHITGRKKNLIVSAAGKNIYPEEIEAALHLSPFILESVIIGKKKDTKMGEEVFAMVVPNLDEIKRHLAHTGDIVPPDDIRLIIDKEVQAVNDRLADYKRINRFEIRMDEFEKTSTRKIKRNLYR